MGTYSPDLLPDLLPIYYKRLFPYGPYYRWLSYGNINPSCFRNREFSFTIGDDIYIRYQSFVTQEEFEKEIGRLCPQKIDIGGVYTCRPRNRSQCIFQVVEKELIFDIDMTDYDEVRTCCSGADVCIKCWKYMVVACKILDVALREDFGYEHLLWVFSGRRGIHCWVCDESARKLDNLARASIAEYLQVITGGEHQAKKVSLIGDIHPSLKRALDYIETVFEKICLEEQDILGNKERIMKVSALILDDGFRQTVEKELLNLQSSRDRWNKFLQLLHDQISRGNLRKKLRNLKEEIMLQYLYPRLDIHVTKGNNHLLKSPFCIHPKTGKVCIPFNPKAVDKFDPTTVPTISDLLKEVGDYDEKQKKVLADDEQKPRLKDYKKTSIYKNINIFEDFVRSLESTWKGKNAKIELSDQKMEF